MKKKHRRNTLKNMLLTVLSVLSLGLASISGAQTLHRGIGGEPGTLDPNLVSGNWEDMVVGDLFLGLVTDAADGRVIPGAATDWTVSDDGTVYTFHLRKDGKWSDGQPVTAHDFVFSLRRVMDPQTASTYAYILYPIKNAEAINTGKIRDLSQLGVRAIDDYTLEITLESSTPYFLELLTHYTAFPIPKHVVERYGKDWVKPGHLVSNGAYKLVEWLPQTHIKAVKNEWFYDADHVAIDTVFYYPTEDRSAALKRFRAGELDPEL